jgi:hypothetical protein
VPAVGIHTAPFARLLQAVLRGKGAAAAPQVFVPQPVSGRSAAELRSYVDGDDPVTGAPVMRGVIDALTTPVERVVEHTRDRPRLLAPAGDETLHDLFRKNGWTDNLPVVLPTQERVAAMLAGTSRAPDDVVGRLRPALQEAWEFTVEKVAINAVMAGARPEYLPVILAIASSGVSARTSSISGMAAMAAVHGPIRHEIGINSGIGALGPHAHANATIGRAYGLLSINLQGGSVPGVSYFGSQGNPGSYGSVCFGENEERSPWPPSYLERGFAAGDSVVTVFGSVRTSVYRHPPYDGSWAAELLRALDGLELAVSPVIVLDPLAAERLRSYAGLESSGALAGWIAEHATRPLGDVWATYEGQNLLRARAVLGHEPWAARLDADPAAPVPLFAQDDVHVLVSGGETHGSYRVLGATPIVTVGVDAWR